MKILNDIINNVTFVVAVLSYIAMFTWVIMYLVFELNSTIQQITNKFVFELTLLPILLISSFAIFSSVGLLLVKDEVILWLSTQWWILKLTIIIFILYLDKYVFNLTSYLVKEIHA